MTPITLSPRHASDRFGAMPMRAERPSALCSVRLIDRRTGTALRLNGQPLALFTRDPQTAAAELLAGRDATHWEVRIDRLEPGRPR